MKKARLALLLLIFISMMGSAFALDATLTIVATGLNSPVELVTVPDGTNRRFIAEQTGKIKVLMPNGEMQSTPFLDISSRLVKLIKAFDERGLLGLAFHPDYANNGKFYVYYSRSYRGGDLGFTLFGNHTSNISEFRVSKNNPNVADPASERVILQIDQPQFNHNGGSLHFGPDDGHLYISTGDGGFADDWGFGHHRTMGNGQDLNTLLGKILRIDVNSADSYEIPADNPFVDQDGIRPEIWAFGFRNPWRMSFDLEGGRQLFVADVQQNSFEEVNIVTRGGNYGWRIKEGKHCFNHLDPNSQRPSCNDWGTIDPIFEYKHCATHPGDCKGISISGGAVYRGSHGPWQGKYFFGDWNMSFGVGDGRLYVASNNGGTWEMEDINITNMDAKMSILAVSQDSDGEVYALTTQTMGPTGGDIIYKITP